MKAHKQQHEQQETALQKVQLHSYNKKRTKSLLYIAQPNCARWYLSHLLLLLSAMRLSLYTLMYITYVCRYSISYNHIHKLHAQHNSQCVAICGSCKQSMVSIDWHVDVNTLIEY